MSMSSIPTTSTPLKPSARPVASAKGVAPRATQLAVDVASFTQGAAVEGARKARALAAPPPITPTRAQGHDLALKAASVVGAFAGGALGLVGMDVVMGLVAPIGWCPPAAVVVALIVAAVGGGIAAGWSGVQALGAQLDR